MLSRLEDMAPAAEASDAWAGYGYLGAATITRTARPSRRICLISIVSTAVILWPVR